MFEIIDLSQDIFSGMPVFPGLPEVTITLHASHEQWEGLTGNCGGHKSAERQY